MPADNKSKKDDKVFDVAKPGKSAPSPTSKPVIVTNRPVLTDPMVVEEKPAKEEPLLKEAPSATRVKIQPLTPTEKPIEKPAEESAEPEPAATDDTVDDDDNLGIPKKSQAEAEDAEALAQRQEEERQANFDKIAMAKTYYLPINQVVRRRSKHMAIAGIILIVILGLAWADVALDAGLIEIPGITAPTQFFSN